MENVCVALGVLGLLVFPDDRCGVVWLSTHPGSLYIESKPSSLSRAATSLLVGRVEFASKSCKAVNSCLCVLDGNSGLA